MARQRTLSYKVRCPLNKNDAPFDRRRDKESCDVHDRPRNEEDPRVGSGWRAAAEHRGSLSVAKETPGRASLGPSGAWNGTY